MVHLRAYSGGTTLRSGSRAKVERARAFMGRDAGSLARLVCPAHLPAQGEASTSLSLRQNYRTWTAEYDHPPTDQLPMDTYGRNFKRLEGRSVLALLRYPISEIIQSFVSGLTQYTKIDASAKSVYIFVGLGSASPQSACSRRFAWDYT